MHKIYIPLWFLGKGPQLANLLLIDIKTPMDRSYCVIDEEKQPSRDMRLEFVKKYLTPAKCPNQKNFDRWVADMLMQRFLLWTIGMLVYPHSIDHIVNFAKVSKLYMDEINETTIM